MKTGLLHPYPGSKKDWREYPVWDEGRYDAWIEPFVGAGHQVHRALARGIVKSAFISDIDPAVLSVWHAWRGGWGRGDDWRRHVEEFVNQYAEKVQCAMDDFYFQELKGWLEAPHESDPLKLTTASIILRKLVFGGVLRFNSQGKLNVGLSLGKLEQFSGWRLEWPHFDASWALSISHRWQGCLADFEVSDCTRAIAFLDPPYYYPPNSRAGGRGSLTPVYTHHGDPQSDHLKQLFLDCLERLLRNPNVARVVCTNYLSPELVGSVEAIARDVRGDFRLTPMGTLQTMNNGVNGEARRDAPEEGFWEFGGRMMAGRYEQKSLLELVV